MEIDLIVDSGGGMVSGTSALADTTYKYKDQITAYGKGVVASAAMWAYSAAGKRYAEDTTLLGSIGVVTSVFDDEDFWKQYGIVWKDIVSENAKNKRPDVKTPEGEAEVKRYLTSLENRFLYAMERNLEMSRNEIISRFREGGIVTGMEAFDFGAIHGIIGANPKKREENGMNPEEKEAQMKELQSNFDSAQATISAKEKELNDLSSKMAETEKALAEANEKIASYEKMQEETKEVVAMAFEHGCDKETTMSIIGMSKGDAAVEILGSKRSSGAAPKGDFQEDKDSIDSEIDGYFKEQKGKK